MDHIRLFLLLLLLWSSRRQPREAKNKRLRVLSNPQIVIHANEIGIEAAGKGAHGHVGPH